MILVANHIFQCYHHAGQPAGIVPLLQLRIQLIGTTAGFIRINFQKRVEVFVRFSCAEASFYQ